MRNGVLQAVGAYIFWGISPIFWKGLSGIPAMYQLQHRIFWTFVVMIIVQTLRGSWPTFRLENATKKSQILGVFSAFLIGTNWLVWVWAMSADRVLEGSLGYFINPLVNVFLGVIFLGESLRSRQWVAISMAALGVVWLTVSVGSLPWVSLVLAGTFGLYGLCKKLAAQSSLTGLTSEMMVLVLPAAIFLLFRTFDENKILTSASSKEILLLLATGFFTAAPLLLFAASTRKVPLSIIGLLQYLAPTVQFLLGVVVYKEAFDSMQLVGFIIIWLALAVFVSDGLRFRWPKVS